MCPKGLELQPALFLSHFRVNNLIRPWPCFVVKTRLDPSVRSCAKVVVIPEKFRKILKRLGLLQDTNQSFGYWCKVQFLQIMHFLLSKCKLYTSQSRQMIGLIHCNTYERMDEAGWCASCIIEPFVPTWMIVTDYDIREILPTMLYHLQYLFRIAGSTCDQHTSHLSLFFLCLVSWIWRSITSLLNLNVD